MQLVDVGTEVDKLERIMVMRQPWAGLVIGGFKKVVLAGKYPDPPETLALVATGFRGKMSKYLSALDSIRSVGVDPSRLVLGTGFVGIARFSGVIRYGDVSRLGEFFGSHFVQHADYPNCGDQGMYGWKVEWAVGSASVGKWNFDRGGIKRAVSDDDRVRIRKWMSGLQ